MARPTTSLRERCKDPEYRQFILSSRYDYDRWNPSTQTWKYSCSEDEFIERLIRTAEERYGKT